VCGCLHLLGKSHKAQLLETYWQLSVYIEVRLVQFAFSISILAILSKYELNLQKANLQIKPVIQMWILIKNHWVSVVDRMGQTGPQSELMMESLFLQHRTNILFLWSDLEQTDKLGSQPARAPLLTDTSSKLLSISSSIRPIQDICYHCNEGPGGTSF